MDIAKRVIYHDYTTLFSKKSKAKYPGQYFLFYVAWYGLGRFMIEGLRTDSLMIPGTDLRASQWLAALSFVAAAGILLFNHFRNYEPEPRLEEDTEDLEDEDNTEELAELDGASDSDIDDESKEDVEDIEQEEDKAEDDETKDEEKEEDENA